MTAVDASPPKELPLTAKAFKTDQDVRWCPGCGDYAILNSVQRLLPELGLKRENIVFVSGIGCSSRFPYYLNTYGMHSIHGRAPAIATGLAVARPDLSVWVVTGDGDALSIGGNHLIHVLRRNVNVKILLFNNEIYGLTKGQYSPTSKPGKITKSTPMGSIDHPFNAVSLALGAEATFVARALDSDRAGLTRALRAAARHRGTAVVEIFQNCPVFNDGAFDLQREPGRQHRHLIPLRHREPVRFGASGEIGVIRDSRTGTLSVRAVAESDPESVVVHDEQRPDPSQAFSLSRLGGPDPAHIVTGVFRAVQRPTYDDLARAQVEAAKEAAPANLAALLRGNESWTVT
ncbi:2-oxoacid:ferredoxin oxidoreductase subunit beta [Amycolatopsis sp. NPDC059090]|uniref:2-oxoacid:ferredoxin oxidoreductase subunit beta n=1 Tax=Amycolatopsis sp. NPDC059090 TaxID=3346723 RepID=UPI0036710E23